MLTLGDLNASHTERSRTFGTVANRSIGRPLARRKSNWMAAATRRSSRKRSQTAEMSFLLRLKNCWTSTSDILEGRVSAPMKRWANDAAGSSTGTGLPIYTFSELRGSGFRTHLQSARGVGENYDRVNLSKKYDYPDAGKGAMGRRTTG